MAVQKWRGRGSRDDDPAFFRTYREKIANYECPTCHTPKGERCRSTRTGNILQLSETHVGRLRMGDDENNTREPYILG